VSRFSALADRSLHRERRRTNTVAIRPPLKSVPTTALYWSWTLGLASADWQSRCRWQRRGSTFFLHISTWITYRAWASLARSMTRVLMFTFGGQPAVCSGLEARLSRYLSPPLFPVHLRDLPKVVCHEVPRPPFDIGPFRIQTALVCHPGPTVGYRIEAAGASMVYLPRP
jgi:hypothetical protein